MSTATLRWDTPTTRVNTDPLAPADIAGFDVYDGSIGPSTKIGTAMSSPFTTPQLAPGDHIFSVVVRTVTGAVSTPLSGNINIPAVESPPNPITNLVITVNP